MLLSGSDNLILRREKTLLMNLPGDRPITGDSPLFWINRRVRLGLGLSFD